MEHLRQTVGLALAEFAREIDFPFRDIYTEIDPRVKQYNEAHEKCLKAILKIVIEGD